MLAHLLFQPCLGNGSSLPLFPSLFMIIRFVILSVCAHGRVAEKSGSSLELVSLLYIGANVENPFGRPLEGVTHAVAIRAA